MCDEEKTAAQHTHTRTHIDILMMTKTMQAYYLQPADSRQFGNSIPFFCVFTQDLTRITKMALKEFQNANEKNGREFSLGGKKLLHVCKLHYSCIFAPFIVHKSM